MENSKIAVFFIGIDHSFGDCKMADIVYGNCNVVSIDHHPIREDNPYFLNIVDHNF